MCSVSSRLFLFVDPQSILLGFVHEQSRPDRDEFVLINWNNIEPRKQMSKGNKFHLIFRLENHFNFNMYSGTDLDTLGTPYDYGSVMHYEWNAFAIDSRIATIIPVKNASAAIGQRLGLSPIDIREIQRYYECSATTSTVTTTQRRTSIMTRPLSRHNSTVMASGGARETSLREYRCILLIVFAQLIDT
jgi:hypothetical protein